MKNFFPNRILKKLANLKLAIGLLFLIGFVIALGTFIEQGQSIIFYKTNYPESSPIFGFVDWQFIFAFGLNEVYTSYWFILILFIFGLSLISCTFTTQLPLLKQFKRWQFITSDERFKKLNTSDLLNLTANNLAYRLHKNHYHIFRQNTKSYSYSGLLGRIGPIFVHFSIICLILGSLWSSFSGYTAQEIVPRGEIFHVQNLLKSGNTSYVPQSFSWRVNDFWITYTDQSKTSQFYSDLSVLNNEGVEVKRKVIFVNEPFVYKDTTLYQTDWDIAGLKIGFNDNVPTQIPLQKINKNGRKFWLGSVPVGIINGVPINYSILVNDLTGNLLIYNENGELVQGSKVGEVVTVNNGINIKFYDFVTTTGLQIKTDFGIPLVYFSFFLLMISIYISFISYSQVWEYRTVNNLFIGGKSNRAVLYFQQELKKILQPTRRRF